MLLRSMLRMMYDSIAIVAFAVFSAPSLRIILKNFETLGMVEVLNLLILGNACIEVNGCQGSLLACHSILLLFSNALNILTNVIQFDCAIHRVFYPMISARKENDYSTNISTGLLNIVIRYKKFVLLSIPQGKPIARERIVSEPGGVTEPMLPAHNGAVQEIEPFIHLIDQLQQQSVNAKRFLQKLSQDCQDKDTTIE